MKVGITAFCILFGFSFETSAYEPPIQNPVARFHPVASYDGMVVSQEQNASQVGADILAKGGNAIDAAVATGFALAVTLPRAGNIGGGGFMLIYLKEQNKTIAIDYREMAPLVASAEMYLNDKAEVDIESLRYSGKSSGVPGTVAGLLHAHSVYGKLSLEDVMSPAISLAKNGIEVSFELASSLSKAAKRLKKNHASASYFYHSDGSHYAPGEKLVQQDLANTLTLIKTKGRDGFYRGPIADLLVTQMKRTEGLMTHQDLENYQVVEREPVCGPFKDYQVCSMPPPSSGGVHLIQMLNILAGWDLKALGHNSAAYIHRLIETMRRAYADRSRYLGDPDFVKVPTKELVSKSYAERLRNSIDLNKASLSTDIEPGKLLPDESTETTHFSTWDQWGNVVSNTYTLNFSYGNGIAVEGAGFLLNNEMDDFSAKPKQVNAFGLMTGTANSIEPQKRPLSSMTPTIVLNKQGSPLLATGSPGGATIINTVLQTILNVLVFDMNVAQATAAPRIHHQWMPDELSYESGISIDTLSLLKNMGHQLKPLPRVLGSTQSIGIDEQNIKYGAADYRRDGAQAAAQGKQNNTTAVKQ